VGTEGYAPANVVDLADGLILEAVDEPAADAGVDDDDDGGR
jgi:hypothetical protein